MKSVSTIAAALLAAFALCGVARADTVRLTGFNGGLSAGVDLDAPRNVSTHGGEYSGLWNGNSFNGICVDVYQNISFNTTYTDYSAVSIGAYGFSSAQQTLFNKLYTNHYADSRTSNAKAAAFQIAAWEITYDGNASLNTANGTFVMGSGGSALAKSIASGWLGSLAGESTGNLAFTVLKSNRHQDLLLATPVPGVPEPSAYAMLLAGLGVMGGIARRRKASAGG